jgi:hypothetical protein
MSDRADVIEQEHRASLRPRTREVDATGKVYSLISSPTRMD